MSVGFAVNCFERTYREVLTPVFAAKIRREQCGAFDHLYLLVSNVGDIADARIRADAVRGEPNLTVIYVDEHLDTALRTTGLRRHMLEPMLWYSAAPLVAATVCSEKWLVYWDADIWLDEPHDWITPCIAKLAANPQLFHANPRWRLLDAPDTLEAETERFEDDFAIGHGFSDQVFLVERERLTAPIYRYFSRASLRFPTIYHASIFEQRVDAYTNRKHLLRATYLPIGYTHPPSGTSYPSNRLTPVRRTAVRLLKRILWVK